MAHLRIMFLFLPLLFCKAFMKVLPRNLLMERTNRILEYKKIIQSSNDELIDMSELLHVPLISYHFDGLTQKMDGRKLHTIIPQIKSLFLIDKKLLACIVIFSLLYKQMLRLIYEILHLNRKTRKAYELTFLGYIDPCVRCISFFFPVLYAVDIFSIVVSAIGNCC